MRVLSQALEVNPNTAHKVVAELVRAGILEMLPGVGTVVADRGPASTEERRASLRDDVERLALSQREVVGRVPVTVVTEDLRPSDPRLRIRGG